MSQVTNLIVSFHPLEDSVAVERHINEFLQHSVCWRHLDKRDQPSPLLIGGTKNLERPTMIGAFNYFDLEVFLSKLTEYDWEESSHVQVFACEQGDDCYTERYQEWLR